MCIRDMIICAEALIPFCHSCYPVSLARICHELGNVIQARDNASIPSFFAMPGDFSSTGRFQRLALLNEADSFNRFSPRDKASYSPYRGLTPGKPDLVDLANIISKVGHKATLTRVSE